ncbi:MAG: adenylate/guanylate cyclase domain-containing protein [Chlamydiales bacterium]|nr:adenylate/guanylate cyclase domain-containing protein [Chlamydiales bacterium]
MKIREKLFLWIGGLFFLVFFASFFFENRATSKILLKAEKNLRAEILQIDEAKRKGYEKFLSVRLHEELFDAANPSQAILEKMMRELSLSTGEAALLIEEGCPLLFYTPEGVQAPIPPISSQETALFQEKSTGIITFEGKSYVFLRFQPIKERNLFFFIFNLEAKEFAIINQIDVGTKEVLYTISFQMRMIAIAALGLVLLLLHNFSRRMTRPIVMLAEAAQSVEKGKLEGITIPHFPPNRTDEIATLCEAFGKMVSGLQEKEKVKGVLNKVVSPEIAREILKGTVHLGGEERVITVLFADIRHFTHLSQNMTPKEVIEMLNVCMTRVSHVIDEFGGVIDKYVGDEVMALFGAPIEREDSPLSAIRCSLAIVEELKRWNEERAVKGLPKIEMGIGLHTGNVLAGNMGAENRLNYTVLGRNVNLAARLCSAAEGMQILISKQTLEADDVSAHIAVQELPPMQFKGFDGEIKVYAVKGEKA